MGAIIKYKDYTNGKQVGMLKPIVFCRSDFAEVHDATSVNRMLAEQLIKYDPSRRTVQLERCLTQIITGLIDGVVIKDFDVLFNPTYKVDVLRMLVTVCKKKNFKIVWPGKLDDNKLYYAEEGFPDYKVFSISDYDITCVV